MSVNKRGRDLSDFEKGQIIALRNIAHFTIDNISENLTISRNTVKKILQQQSVDVDLDSNRSNYCGRQKCTTQEQDMNLIQLSKNNPFATRTQLKEAAGIECCNSTIAKRLHKVGLKTFKPAKRTLLSDNHKIARLN